MRKSAASFKPVVTKSQEDIPTLEETWENAKQAFINTAEVSVQLAGRIDNLMNIRDMVYKFWEPRGEFDKITLDYLKEKLEFSKFIYERVLTIVKTFEMDEFLKEDMKDYFEEIIPKPEDILNEEDLLNAAIVFLTVKPWGEKMTALHHTMLDEKKQREFAEK